MEPFTSGSGLRQNAERDESGAAMEDAHLLRRRRSSKIQASSPIRTQETKQPQQSENAHQTNWPRNQVQCSPTQDLHPAISSAADRRPNEEPTNFLRTQSSHLGSSMETNCKAIKKWEHELCHRESLRIIATTPIPPPMTGNASILEGLIPEFLGVRDPEVAAISFLQKGNPVVERRIGSKVIQQKIRPFSFCITPAGTGYEYRTSDHHTSLNVALNNASLQEFAETEMGAYAANVHLKECLECRSPPEMIELFSSFARLIRNPRKGSRLYFETLWSQLALQLLWHHSSIAELGNQDDTGALSPHRINVITSYLEENLSLDTSLSELAAVVHLSPGHFLRAFKRATGCTPVRYRMNLRITRARHLLSRSSLTVTEIAMILGFASTSHFSETFRRKVGKSPSSYRAESSNRAVEDQQLHENQKQSSLQSRLKEQTDHSKSTS